jgi:hypothetical protein
MAIHMRKVLGGAQPPRALAPARWCGTGSYGSGARRTRKSLTSSRCRGRRSRPPRKMIRAALESCGEMQDLVACAGELTRSRGFAQLVGDLSIMLGAGYGGASKSTRAPIRWDAAAYVHDNGVYVIDLASGWQAIVAALFAQWKCGHP